MEKGMEKGIDKGISQGQLKLLTALLRQRFGEVPEWAVARLRAAAPAQVETWALRVLEAESLEQVFEAGRPH